MGLHQSTLEATPCQFRLHVCELAYILSLMNVRSVAILPGSVLFPKDPCLKKKVLEEGEKRLITEGRIIPGATLGTATYNEDLLSMSAVVADPRFSILIRRETNQRERADATIFFNEVEIVELIQTDRHTFRLRRLPNSTYAFHQIRKFLGILPLSRHTDVFVELGIGAFQQIRQHAALNEIEEAISLLTSANLAPEAANDFVMALAAPRQKGVISILKHVDQKVTDVRVIGFHSGNIGTWLVSVVSESTNRVRLEIVDPDGFIRRLLDRVTLVLR